MCCPGSPLGGQVFVSHLYCGCDSSLNDQAVRELPRELPGAVASFDFHAPVRTPNKLVGSTSWTWLESFIWSIDILPICKDFFFTPPQKSRDNQECW